MGFRVDAGLLLLNVERAHRLPTISTQPLLHPPTSTNLVGYHLAMSDHKYARAAKSQTSGNGLFANKAFGAGELILSIRRPLVGVVDVARVNDTCANCFTWTNSSVGSLVDDDSETNVKACSGCKYLRFCGKVSIGPIRRCIRMITLPKGVPKGGMEAASQVRVSSHGEHGLEREHTNSCEGNDAALDAAQEWPH
jgi:hypothetical protein